MKLDPEREAAISYAKREIERTLREPGFFQWIELANERTEEMPTVRWRRFHERIFDLIQEYARELGITDADTVQEGSTLANLMIGAGRDDDDDDESETVPEPEHPEAIPL